MSKELSHKSHPLAWTLAPLIAVPLLYALSVPWVIIGVARLTPVPHAPHPPKWLDAYAVPYVWMVERTPLEKPLHAYESWCYGMWP